MGRCKSLLTLLRHPAGMRALCLLVFLLAACNAPSRDFRGVTAQRITISGSTFDIRVIGEQAEAIRVNAEYAPRFGPIEGRAAQAMAQVSGCDVERVSGDQAHILGQLDCDGTPSPAPLPRAPLDLECFEVDRWISRGAGVEYAEYDCDAI